MPLGVDAIILMALALPVPLKYRILPIEGTPYWLFGLLFLLMVGNVLVSVYPSWVKKYLSTEPLKNFFLWTTLLIVLGGATVTAIVDRSKVAPVHGVHDIILQQEAAMRYLLEGKNPYKETYFGTPMEQWHYSELGKDAVNPALYHFVMPPWYMLSPFLFYAITLPLLGYFDGRFILLFCVFLTVWIVFRWFKQQKIAHLAIILLTLAPGIIDYFIEGRSDAFAIAWFLWSLYLLDRRKLFWSAIIFGLALTSKQTIWFAAPFYMIYIWWVNKKSFRKTVMYLVLTGVTVGVLVLPFLLWDPRAFIDSVVLFVSGGVAQGYPISGYGLSMLLYELGIIKDIHAYYPFVIWQAALGIPTLLGTLWFLLRKPSMSRFLMCYGMTLFVIWYLSRYFNNSHLGYISTIFSLGVLKDWDEQVV